MSAPEQQYQPESGVSALPSDRAATASQPSPQAVSGIAGIPSALNECRDDGGDHFMCGCITRHVRDIMQFWAGTNCTWADDDVTALGILAGRAIRAGLHHDAAIPQSLIRCIDKHVAASAIEAAAAGETAKTGSTEGESAVGQSRDAQNTASTPNGGDSQ